ncbi:Metacaspase-1 [Quillaja saponaria]|uniref:Metacaspase-1 n=1 Tax=Quillaja saponaria TaxID=32244 RepID=A0AAD7M1I3_QUISA|nr:Metacaspase-1 [Quillaja saponaria]
MAICLSACGDDTSGGIFDISSFFIYLDAMKLCLHQFAYEHMQAFGGKGMNGVITYLLAKTIRENLDITYGDLVEKMHEEIEQIKIRTCHRIRARVFGQSIVVQPDCFNDECKFRPCAILVPTV